MCGLLPLMAAGKVKPKHALGAMGGLTGLALTGAFKKDKPKEKTNSETFYGTPSGPPRG